jgi:putative oxidoreductase
MIGALLDRLERLATRLAPHALVALLLRVALAVPFFRSGLTKWDGFLDLSDTPLLLFENEFKLHVLGKVYDYPFPLVAAWASSVAEIVLPVLLVLGVGSRLAAFALLLMTLVIQLTIPDGWPIHITWAAMALAAIVLGPGRMSIDSLLLRRA